MKLLFDLTAVQPSQGKFHGGGEYARAVLYELLRIKKKTDEFSCVYDSSSWIDSKILEDCRAAGVLLHEVDSKKGIQDLIKNNEFNIFYSAMPYNYDSIDFGATRFALTIHGLRDIEMPTDKYEYLYTQSVSVRLKYLIKQLLPKWYRRRCLKKSAALINNPNKLLFVPSLHTKYSILTHYDIDESDIKVFYSPPKLAPKPVVHDSDAAVKQLVSDAGRYVLCIGGNRWIKNAYRALKAFESLDFENISVIVSGGSQLGRYFSDNKNIHFIDYVEASTLEFLYKNCSVLLYPSLNEGFGYPPLEVMKYGKPVLASAVASLSEIYGDSLLYVDPYNVDEIASRLLMLLTNEEVYSHYARLSKEKYKELGRKQKSMLKSLASSLLKG